MIINDRSKFWVKDLERQNADAEYIKSLDPLGVDDIIQKLPQFNKAGDVDQIIRYLYKFLPLPDMLEAFSVYECHAAMRDLGIFMGSIKRHDKEPVEEVPELDYVLGELSAKADMPPRDTLLHYTSWNPDADRMRTYTHYRDECELIRSVKVSMPPLMQGIYLLIDIYWESPFNEQFIEDCELAHDSFREVVEGIVLAKRNVSPELFGRELRLYFDPIEIYNKSLIGPGAVEMPLFVYDYILWGADIHNEEYQQFSRNYVQFNLPAVRDIYYNFVNKPSLVTKMIKKLFYHPDNDSVLRSANALLKLCKLEKSFRMPHKKLAEESYKEEAEGGRKVGSGGYSTDILGKILRLNILQINKLEAAIEICKERK